MVLEATTRRFTFATAQACITCRLPIVSISWSVSRSGVGSLRKAACTTASTRSLARISAMRASTVGSVRSTRWKATRPSRRKGRRTSSPTMRGAGERASRRSTSRRPTKVPRPVTAMTPGALNPTPIAASASRRERAARRVGRRRRGPGVSCSAMSARRATVVVEAERCREHAVPEGHPERPARLDAVHAAIAARESALERIAARPATPEELLRVHAREHLALVAEAARRAPVHLDPDTPVSPGSLDAALVAAGASVDLARRVAAGGAAGLAAVRPPGHHAESTYAMGFCLFNNVAIAARALQAEDGVERILILDWDVHHGNGTQHCFEADPNVLYASTHQFPFYPGTGAAHEAGRDAGLGATLNVPMPAGCGDAEYVGALQRLLVPVARAFRPEVVLVSCGFDAHRDDPLAQMQLSGEGL